MIAFKFAAKRLSGAFRAMANELRHRAHISMLSELNDRALADMGLVRGQLEFELRNGRADIGR